MMHDHMNVKKVKNNYLNFCYTAKVFTKTQGIQSMTHRSTSANEISRAQQETASTVHTYGPSDH
jgi:hypothetical protein